jgi:hypothetical protein
MSTDELPGPPTPNSDCDTGPDAGGRQDHTVYQPTQNDVLNTDCDDRADCADPISEPSVLLSLESLMGFCASLKTGDVALVDSEVFTKVYTLALTDAEIDAVLKVTAGATGISRTALRSSWKAFLKAIDDTASSDRASGMADLLVKIAKDETELFHTPDQMAFMDVRAGADDHRETYPLTANGAGRWLRKIVFERHGKVPNSMAVRDALDTLTGIAQFQGPERQVFVRLGWHEEDGQRNIYLDLADPTWRVVEITCDGIEIITDPPVRFRRSPHMLPIPEPTHGGSFNDLRAVMNVNDEEWALLSGFTLGMLQPNGPFPILQLAGEMGSGKTSAAKRLKALVDPSKGGLRAEPREISDLMVAANQCAVLAFDNLSRISPPMADAYCRLTSQGAIGSRRLYTDDEEHVLEATRPVIMTGINDLATRPDLMDRMVIVTLGQIAETERRTDADLDKHFEKIRPGVTGALLMAVSAALRNRDQVKLERLPRMADFAVWVVAGEEALGLKQGDFMRAYKQNRNEMHHLALEANVLPNVVLRLMEDRRKIGKWSGSPTALLKELEQVATTMGERILAAYDWPRTPIHLSGQLKRYAPNLRALGLQVRSSRSGGERKWILEWMETGSEDAGGTGTPGTIGTSPALSAGLEEVQVSLETSQGEKSVLAIAISDLAITDPFDANSAGTDAADVDPAVTETARLVSEIESQMLEHLITTKGITGIDDPALLIMDEPDEDRWKL